MRLVDSVAHYSEYIYRLTLLDRFTSRFYFAKGSKTSKATAIQDAARKSLVNLLRPLSLFVSDCGLSISEVNSILRMTAVQCAAARQLEDSTRVNISGIAAITGIPRGEVSRILNSRGSVAIAPIERHQNVASRILIAWHRDPYFLTADCRPRELKIFGDGPTFESLARKYGQGIPIRAILDELKRVGAIQLQTSSQKILPKKVLAISPRINRKTICDFDALVDILISCLLSTSDSAFVEKVSGTKAWSGLGPRIRQKSGPNAIALLRVLQNELGAKQAKHPSEDLQKVARLGVTIVYKEERVQSAKYSVRSRRNLHRNR